MDEHDLEIEDGPTADEAAALVSKWLDDSEDEENDEIDHSGAPSSSHSGPSAVSRALGVGLGAEDLNDLVAQRRLDPTERKMKYKMEANAKWKEQREQEALALAKRLDDDVYDLESKSMQISKKRQRGMSKSAFLETLAAPKKKSKVKEIETEIVTTKHEVKPTGAVKVEEEVLFDFSASAVEEKPATESKEVKEKEKSSKSDHKSPSKSSKDKHKKKHDKHKEKHKDKHHKK